MSNKHGSTRFEQRYAIDSSTPAGGDVVLGVIRVDPDDGKIYVCTSLDPIEFTLQDNHAKYTDAEAVAAAKTVQPDDLAGPVGASGKEARELIEITSKISFPGKAVQAIAWNGEYWLIGGDGDNISEGAGLVKWDGVTATDLSGDLVGFGSGSNAWIQSIGWNADDGYWLIGGKNGKVNKYDGSTFTDLSSAFGFSANEVSGIIWNGEYWLLVTHDVDDNKLARYDGSTVTKLGDSLIAWTDVAWDIGWNGSYWLISGFSGLLNKYDGSTFTDLKDGIQPFIIRTDIGEGFSRPGGLRWVDDKTGSYWLIGGGTFDDPDVIPVLVRYDGTTWTDLSGNFDNFNTALGTVLDILPNGPGWLLLNNGWDQLNTSLNSFDGVSQFVNMLPDATTITSPFAVGTNGLIFLITERGGFEQLANIYYFHVGAPSIAAGAVTREGGNTTEATTTSTSDVDILSVTGITVTGPTPMVVMFNIRKTSGAADSPKARLRLNTTDSTITDLFTNSDRIERGPVQLQVNARVTNYLNSLLGRSLTQLGNTAVEWSTGGADWPTADITAVIVRGHAGDASITFGVDELQVYGFAAS